MSPSHSPGAPQRRFTGKMRIFDEQRRQEFAAAGYPVVPQDELMVLEDYLDISRRRHLTRVPLFKLQMHMLQDLVTAERMIGQYKEEAKKLSGKTPPDTDEPEDESSSDPETPEEGTSEAHAAELRAINRELFFLKTEVRALRDIGDGIAWRLFDYDRAVLHELARRPSGKHINLQGLEAELYALGSYFNTPGDAVAVLNDLTNFLKFGDITVRHNAGDFEIVEVKAGTSGGARVRRQKEGLTELVSLLSVDQGREIKGEPVKISSVDIVPEMFIGNLRGLLNRAATNGAAVEIIGSHLMIQCMDFMAIREKGFDKDRAFAIMDGGWAVLKRWEAASDFFLPLDSHHRLAHAQNYVPLSIFPLEPKPCARLLSGAVRLRAYVNISAVLRELEGRGWKIVKSPAQLVESGEALTGEVPMAVLRKDPLTTHVPATLFGRLGMEFLKPRSLAQLLDAMLEQRGEKGGHHFINFAGEPRMWR